MGEDGGRLHATGLSVSFGGLQALAEVDLEVEPGGITGLIGPNGAGKTTLIDAVTGFVRPGAGRVQLDGRDVTDLAPAARARAGLVRTFQSLELFEDLTVAANLRVAAERPPWWGGLADAVGVRRADPTAADVEAALAVVGLAQDAERRPTDLSHGARKLVAVARALAGRPRVLLLDEPAAGLDATETAALGERLRAVAAEGVTLLLVDHDMSLVFEVCDRVHVLDRGSVIAVGPPEAVRHDPVVVSAYLGAPVP